MLLLAYVLLSGCAGGDPIRLGIVDIYPGKSLTEHGWKGCATGSLVHSLLARRASWNYLSEVAVVALASTTGGRFVDFDYEDEVHGRLRFRVYRNGRTEVQTKVCTDTQGWVLIGAASITPTSTWWT